MIKGILVCSDKRLYNMSKFLSRCINVCIFSKYSLRRKLEVEVSCCSYVSHSLVCSVVHGTHTVRFVSIIIVYDCCVYKKIIVKITYFFNI